VELKKLYNIANEAKNAVKSILYLSNSANSGDYTPEEAETHKNNIKPATEKFTKIETKAGELPSTQKVVDLYKKELETKKETPSTKPTKAQKDKPTQEIVPPQPIKTSTKPIDVFAPLQSALSDKEIWLVRRVFKSFSDNCPEASKKLIEELKVMVVKDLSKK
jgi:hypothetical protein